jgi:serine/threonine-protein phosphatase 2A activator
MSTNGPESASNLAASSTVASSSYTPPIKYILSPAHLAAFQRSNTHAEILEFVDELNESVVGVRLQDAGDGSEVRRHVDAADGSELARC